MAEKRLGVACYADESYMQIPLNQELSILEIENSFDEWWRAASKWEKVRSPIRPSVEEGLSALEEATLELILGEGESREK